MAFLARHWRGLAILILGVGTIFTAHYFLDTCADAGKFMNVMGKQVHMGCTWTERAVQGVGGLVGVIGLLMMWGREATRMLSLAAAAAGVLMILIPVWLVPTCANPMMPCNLSLKPGSILLGALVTAFGLIGAIQFRRAGGPEGVA